MERRSIVLSFIFNYVQLLSRGVFGAGEAVPGSRHRFLRKNTMRNHTMRSQVFTFGFLAVLTLFLVPIKVQAASVAILEVDINSYQVNQAVRGLDLPENIEARFFTLADLQDNEDGAKFIEQSRVVFVNVMMPQLSDYLVDRGLLKGRTVYALNKAGDPDKLKEQGFVFDPEVIDYYHNPHREQYGQHGAPGVCIAISIRM